ncbi:MAG: DUF3565 domain-containing protein [Rubripirellula sp.]|nr:DUF3565 domain-containing protein [Rubripirellula sp.]
MTRSDLARQQPITGFHRDTEDHWVAQLACGHNQHVRHDPPLVRRFWTQSKNGRTSMLGYDLPCKKCVEGAAPDEQPKRRPELHAPRPKLNAPRSSPLSTD